MIAEAKAKAGEIVAHGREVQVGDDRRRRRSRPRPKRERIIAAAKAESAAGISQRAREQLRNQVADLAVAGAARDPEARSRREGARRPARDDPPGTVGGTRMAELATDRPTVRRSGVRARARRAGVAGVVGDAALRRVDRRATSASRKALDNPRLDSGGEGVAAAVDRRRPLRRGRRAISFACWSRRERVALLPQIAAMFETLKNEAEATAKATIESAFAARPTRSSASCSARSRSASAGRSKRR